MITDLNACHKNETIFIVGAGEQVNYLSKEDICFLEQSNSIALNFVPYKVKAKYFITAYPHQIQMTQMCSPNTENIQLYKRGPILDNVYRTKLTVFEDSMTTLPSILGPEKRLYSKGNVLLAALHLAIVMGAKNIVCIACDHRSLMHYFYDDEDVRQEIIRDFNHLVDSKTVIYIHKYLNDAEFTKKITMSAEYARTQEFYFPYGSDTFKKYIDIARTMGIGVYTTVEDSLIRDSGAQYIGLEDISSISEG